MLRNPQEKTLQLLVPKSKRLGGYTQMDVLFSSKKHKPLEDPKKRYTISLSKALRRRLYLSTGPEGARRGFQNSTIKCSGAY